MSNLEKILEGSKPDFTYYTSKGGSSTPTDFGQKSIPYGMDRPARKAAFAKFKFFIIPLSLIVLLTNKPGIISFW